MSETIKTELHIKDEQAIKLACGELGLQMTPAGDVKLYSETVRNSIGVQLPRWKYQIAIEPKSGVVKYDNYNGNWGDVKELNRFQQMYAVHTATLAAKRKGYTVRRVQNEGKIQLVMTA